MQAKYKKLLTINGSIIIILIALLVSINLFNSKHLDNNNNEQSKSGGMGNDTQEKINNENSIQIPENLKMMVFLLGLMIRSLLNLVRASQLQMILILILFP